MSSPRSSLVPLWSCVALAFGCVACSDEPPPAVDTPMIAGPFLTNIAIGSEDARTRLPPPVGRMPRDATPRFYWYVGDLSADSIAFEVRAESTALAPGTAIHRVEETIGVGQSQGVLTVAPRDLNRGGVRRGAHGAEWLEGAYSLRTFDGDRELSVLVFEVE